MLILVGAALGLAVLFLDWTGDGRGIDYIQPGNRFEAGYQLPLPLSIFAIATVAACGIASLYGASGLFNRSWRRPALRWLGGLGGLMLATLPLIAHGGYRFWQYWHEGGVRVFRSGDWSVGLWVALAAGILVVTGVVLSAKWVRGTDR